MSEGAHFTIDFIEEEHRESITMLMDILCIDMKAAYDLFQRAGCNTENAINLMTNPSPEKPHFGDSIPRNNRARGNRNGAAHVYEDQMEQIYENFDYEDEHYVDEFQQLPVARRRPPNRVPQENEFDIKFNKLLENKKKKKCFEKNYVIKRDLTAGDSRSIAMKVFDKKTKKQTEKKILNIKPFFKEIEKGLIEKMITIKFGKGTMSESFQQCYRTFQPLLAYHLNFDLEENQNSNANFQKNTKKEFKSKKMVIDITDDNNLQQKMVETIETKNADNYKFKRTEKNQFFSKLLTEKKLERVVNECYLNYIFNPENYDMESYFKEYFQRSTRKQSYLVILRVNYLQQLEFVAKISLDQILEKAKEKDEKFQEQKEEKVQKSNTEKVQKPNTNTNNAQKQSDSKVFNKQISNIIQELKKWSIKCKQSQAEQDKLMDRYRNFERGIYYYQYKKGPTTAQKIKIKQDRQIIKQQQEQFMNMQNEFIQQQIKEISKQGTTNQNNKKASKQQILQKRRIIRQWLRIYTAEQPQAMTIKYRLPSGKTLILHVGIKQKVQYLFDFIQSNEMEDMGFEEEEDGGVSERRFEIIRVEGRVGLEDKSEIMLQQVFQGNLMECVIIKEKQ